jgi:hypothetical protein
MSRAHRARNPNLASLLQAVVIKEGETMQSQDQLLIVSVALRKSTEK